MDSDVHVVIQNDAQHPIQRVPTAKPYLRCAAALGLVDQNHHRWLGSLSSAMAPCAGHHPVTLPVASRGVQLRNLGLVG